MAEIFSQTPGTQRVDLDLVSQAGLAKYVRRAARGQTMNREGNRTSAGHKAVVVFGFLTMAFWLSFALFPHPIPPLGPLPDFEGLLSQITPWIREGVPSLNRPDEEVIASLRRQMIAAYALDWLQIGAGVASGVLIAGRRRAGRWLAMAMCAVLLIGVAVDQGQLVLHDGFVKLWTAKVRFAPTLAVRSVLNVLFFVGTLVYLTRRRVGLVFEPVEASPNTR